MKPYPAPLLFCETMPDEATLLDWLRAIRLNAYVPGSGYKVAALLMMRHDGGFYFAGGVNVECFEHRLNMHGEESAMATLVTAFGKRAVIDAVWVMAAPEHLTGPTTDKMGDVQGQTCGNCRQQISNLAAAADIPVHVFSLNGNLMTAHLNHLLPYSFSFADFDSSIHERRRADRNATASASLETARNRVLRHTPQTDADIFAWLGDLESVDYASGRGQAVVLTLENGHYVAGVKFENAAYTGQGALQAALGIAVSVYGDGVRIAAVHTLSAPHDAREKAANHFYPLPLSAIQSMGEHIRDQTLPVTMFNQAGEAVTLTLAEASLLRTSFQNPAFALVGEALEPVSFFLNRSDL